LDCKKDRKSGYSWIALNAKRKSLEEGIERGKGASATTEGSVEKSVYSPGWGANGDRKNNANPSGQKRVATEARGLGGKERRPSEHKEREQVFTKCES